MARERITRELYSELRQDAASKKDEAPLRNSILNVGLDRTALNYDSKVRNQHTFSIELKTGKATAQEKSGRCWLFAGLNTMRYRIMKDLKLKEFQLSQAYQMFFDKFEKANYFLENILDTLDQEKGSRIIMWLLDAPLNDGGQWDMFTSIVDKYGVVPRSEMPETYHSSNSRRMNSVLTLKLRGYAQELREMHRSGKDMDCLRGRKAEMLKEFYRLLTMFLGIPPDRFDFEYRDSDGEFHRDPGLTPLKFREKYVADELEDFVSIINAPTDDKPFGRTYTVQYLGNVEGGSPVTYLNVEMPLFKKLAVSQLQDGEPVWFGCDVGKFMFRDQGILDTGLFDYQGVLGTRLPLDKAGRLDYGESVMTHAMVFTGVNLPKDSIPDRWRVENSWSDKYGDKGYFVMSDEWFDQFVYQIVVRKKYLPEAMKEALGQEPIVLSPWDPMGSLARD